MWGWRIGVTTPFRWPSKGHLVCGASHSIRPVFDDPNLVAKAACVIGGMLAGADSIDDLDLLRHGAMGRLFSGLRSPSTLGTYLRSATHGHVQQLVAVGTRVLAGLPAQVPGLIADAQEPDGLALIDIDDTIREVHGYAKQGAAYGYSKVRGLNAQLAVLSTPLAYPRLIDHDTFGNVVDAQVVPDDADEAISAGRPDCRIWRPVIE